MGLSEAVGNVASRFENAFLSVVRGNRLLVPLMPILQVLHRFVDVRFSVIVFSHFVLSFSVLKPCV